MPRTPRTNAQRFFLTYSQAADISQSELADFIHSIAPCWLEIVQEFHQDDGIHYHAVVCYDDRLQRPMDVFDFEGCHPNFAVIKNATTDLFARRHYLRKGPRRAKEDEHPPKDHKIRPCDYDTEPETRGEVPEYIESTGRLDWGGILAQATSRDEFLKLVRHSQPKDYVLRHDAIVKFADTQYSEPSAPEEVFPEESWVIPPELDDWVKTVFAEVSAPPAFSLPVKSSYGPSRDRAFLLSVGYYLCFANPVRLWFSRARGDRKPYSSSGKRGSEKPCGRSHSVNITATCADCGTAICSMTSPTCLY